jgi:hypothetical protein
MPLEEFLSMCQAPKDLKGREFNVEEKVNFCMGELPSEHAGEKQQVVVMDPYNIAVFPVIRDLVCKGLVDRYVIFPRMVLECLTLGVVRHLIMK